MARIRTIKPEFPQSESMGRVSRDARLLFVLLWTIADDSGRTRAASRMLASLLFPYDDDAPGLIDEWLKELEVERCIRRYVVEGTTYLEIAKWASHQKIDRPSASKFPGPEEDSRTIAKPREPSSLDQGPRTKDQDQGEDQDHRHAGGEVNAAAPSMQAAVCVTLKAIGIPDVNPGHQTLTDLIEQGADVGMFAAAGRTAVANGKRFAYVLGIVKNQMADARSSANRAAADYRPGETPRERRARERHEELTGERSSSALPGDIIDMEPADPTRLPAIGAHP